MNEIKHPKTVQELLENYLSNYQERKDTEDILFADIKSAISVEEHNMLENRATTYRDRTFSLALENYRIACEKLAWGRACKKQREICQEEINRLYTDIPDEEILDCVRTMYYNDSMLILESPEFETLK